MPAGQVHQGGGKRRLPEGGRGWEGGREGGQGAGRGPPNAPPELDPSAPPDGGRRPLLQHSKVISVPAV